MAVADPTINDRLLVAATHQFLEKGFLDTSLQGICQEAGVTTGALYKRFEGKGGLFDALVLTTYEDLMAFAHDFAETDVTALSDAQLVECWAVRGSESSMRWVKKFWDLGDPFKLLVRPYCTEGTKYSNFHHDFLQVMTDVDYAYLAEAQRRGLARPDIDEMELHVLLTGFWETYYEPFVHDFSWEQIVAHERLVGRFFDWHSALGMRERWDFEAGKRR